MTLSKRSIKTFKKRSRVELWNYVTALEQLQIAIFQLEKDETDSIILKELSARAIEVSDEIISILDLLEPEDEETS